jgi:hypothetical protein
LLFFSAFPSFLYEGQPLVATALTCHIRGWLVLEPWITPSIFQNLDQSLGIVDEFTLTEKLGSKAALDILKPHVSYHQLKS